MKRRLSVAAAVLALAALSAQAEDRRDLRYHTANGGFGVIVKPGRPIQRPGWSHPSVNRVDIWGRAYDINVKGLWTPTERRIEINRTFKF